MGAMESGLMAAGEMDGGGMAGEELDGEIISPWER